MSFAHIDYITVGAVLFGLEPCSLAQGRALALGAVLLDSEPCSWVRSRALGFGTVLGATIFALIQSRQLLIIYSKSVNIFRICLTRFLMLYIIKYLVSVQLINNTDSVRNIKPVFNMLSYQYARQAKYENTLT